jgi:hypothetical protein
MAGIPLFSRDFEIIIGTISIPARPVDPTTGLVVPTLRAMFNIEKNDDSSPNKASVTVYNLNSAHRAAIQEGWPVIVKAGYVGNVQQLFGGWIEKSDNRREGVDWITTVEASDGGNRFRTARVNLSLGKGTTLTALLNAVAASLGLGLGNSAQKFATSRRGLTAFKKGVSVSGMAKNVLNKYISSAGYQWSIQDGVLQVLGVDETSVETVPILNPNSGLIGSPEKGEKGIVKAKSLLNGAIKPGGRIGYKTASIDGFYKVKKVNHSGDTWGADWYTDNEGKPVSPL